MMTNRLTSGMNSVLALVRLTGDRGAFLDGDKVKGWIDSTFAGEAHCVLKTAPSARRRELFRLCRMGLLAQRVDHRLMMISYVEVK
jgi:hypothetical protein